MRFSRVFRWVMRIFLLVLTLSLTGVSVLGSMSAVAILSNPDNINVPSGPINANLNLSDVNLMSVQVPFNVSNVGFFELEKISPLMPWFLIKLRFSRLYLMDKFM